MKICDLHTHSNHSDGTLTPTELLNLAVSEGVSAIALCDHNTIDGLIEFKNAAKDPMLASLEKRLTILGITKVDVC